MSHEIAQPMSFRDEVKVSAKRFKSGWREMAKLLLKVRTEELFKSWGFDTYEAYCLKELHIKKGTALKLVRGQAFLTKHENALFTQPAEQQPELAQEVVETLAQLEDAGRFTENDYPAVREIWKKDVPVAAVKRELMERLPPAKNETDEAVVVAEEFAKIAALAQRLAKQVQANGKISKAMKERVEAISTEFEALAKKRAA